MGGGENSAFFMYKGIYPDFLPYAAKNCAIIDVAESLCACVALEPLLPPELAVMFTLCSLKPVHGIVLEQLKSTP